MCCSDDRSDTRKAHCRRHHQGSAGMGAPLLPDLPAAGGKRQGRVRHDDRAGPGGMDRERRVYNGEVRLVVECHGETWSMTVRGRPRSA